MPRILRSEVWRGRPGTPRSACRCSLYAGQWGSHGGGLLLVHGVMAGAFRRGWEIETYSGEPYGARPGVRDRGAEPSVPDRGRGRDATSPFTDAEIEKWRNEWSWDGSNRAGKLPPPQRKRKEPTGKWRLVLPNGYGGARASWTDVARSLSGRLDHVFEVLELQLFRRESARTGLSQAPASSNSRDVSASELHRDGHLPAPGEDPVGGTHVVIHGHDLTGATKVDFGSRPARSYHVVSDTEITAVAPSSPRTGPVRVTVKTPGGTTPNSPTDRFTTRPLLAPPSAGSAPHPALLPGDGRCDQG